MGIDGIRVEHLKVLLFYDFPPNLEQYCCRVSLLAQGGDGCISFSLLTHQSSHLAGALLSMLESIKARVDPQLRELAKCPAPQVAAARRGKKRRRQRSSAFAASTGSAVE